MRLDDLSLWGDAAKRSISFVSVELIRRFRKMRRKNLSSLSVLCDATRRSITCRTCGETIYHLIRRAQGVTNDDEAPPLVADQPNSLTAANPQTFEHQITPPKTHPFDT
jgi:hypothetical protein